MKGIEKLIGVEAYNGAVLCPTDFVEAEEDNTGFVSKALTDYITSGIGEHKNSDVVKIMSAAMQIASEKGMLETPPISTMQTAVAVYDVVKNMNLSYLVEQGEIRAQEAADAMIDHAAATASVLADTLLKPEVIAMGLNKAIDYASCIYPPITASLQSLKLYTPVIASYVSKVVGPEVKRLIPKLAEKAKSLVKSLIARASDWLKSKMTTMAEPTTRKEIAYQ